MDPQRLTNLPIVPSQKYWICSSLNCTESSTSRPDRSQPAIKGDTVRKIIDRSHHIGVSERTNDGGLEWDDKTSFSENAGTPRLKPSTKQRHSCETGRLLTGSFSGSMTTEIPLKPGVLDKGSTVRGTKILASG